MKVARRTSGSEECEKKVKNVKISTLKNNGRRSSDIKSPSHKTLDVTHEKIQENTKKIIYYISTPAISAFVSHFTPAAVRLELKPFCAFFLVLFVAIFTPLTTRQNYLFQTHERHSYLRWLL